MKRFLFFAAMILSLGLASQAEAANCSSYPYTLTNGQTADANQVMTDFNLILNCANNNLAHNGANSDITSLSNLTTPLSVAQGGTGRSTGGTPTRTVYGSGSGTYTTPANVTWIDIQMVGGGGGGAGSGTAGASGGAGGNTTFDTLTAAGGGAGTNSTGASSGGTATGGDVNIPGGPGQGAANAAFRAGGQGGGSCLGGAGVGGGAQGALVGAAAASNTGSGGGGASSGADPTSGGGGAAGGCLDKIIGAPAISYSYAVGPAGAAGLAGTGANGGAGAVGRITITEYYN